MGSYGTSRPPTERDVLHVLNGSLVYLGQLVSGGTTTPVDNSTTAAPFNAPSIPPQPAIPSTNNLTGTLAGKMLLMQAISAGCLLMGTQPGTTPGVQLVTIQTGVLPGALIQAAERVIVLMRPDMGWLQWVSNSGSATCIVWELT